MQNALFSILLALRNDPDRYFIVDRMELTPFTTTIINYNSFLALRRPPYLQGNEQFASGRILEMAERILHNLQKGIVDSTISPAAGLEKGSSYSYQALPGYIHLKQQTKPTCNFLILKTMIKLEIVSLR